MTKLFFNGIHGETGEYLFPPLDFEKVVPLAQDKPALSNDKSWFSRIADAVKGLFHYGLPMGVDPVDVTQAGWAIVFAEDAPDELRSALEPLVEHRKSIVPGDRFKELEYRSGEELKPWLKRHGVYPGSVSPAKVPYYVTLVGGPSQIPFSFQYLLDIEYAVGRIAFDEVSQYQGYVESLIDYEKSGSPPNKKEIVYWAPRHASDRATQLSADHLITPLYDGAGEEAIAKVLGYGSRCFKGADGRKANLLELLGPSGGPPAMLVTASHGMGWPKGNARQRAAQGALLCQDWPGFGSVKPEHFLTAEDIPSDAIAQGLVAFLFACYGAGTPAYDNFLRDRSRSEVAIAEEPFISALPQRLLSHPNGGAIAVIGHVERAWGYSIQPPGVEAQLQPFRNLIGRILAGEPVGHATKDISERYAVLSAELASQLDTTQPGTRPSDNEMVWNWIERNDAQNYVVLGDPAAQVRVDALPG